MEKISLLLLVVKKALIGSVIAGVVSLGSVTSLIDKVTQTKEEVKSKVEKRAGTGLTRPISKRER